VPGEFYHQESGAASVENHAYKSLLEKREYARLAHLLPVATLIDKGEYLQAADILNKLQLAMAKADDVVMAKIFAAICQICLICSWQRKNADAYRRASEEASMQEESLRQGLRDILEWLGQDETIGLPKSAYFPDFAEAEISKTKERLNIWQRIQSLLGQDPGPQLPEPTISGESVQEPVPRSPEEAKMPKLDPAAKPEPSPAPPISKAETLDLPAVRQIQDQNFPSLAVYCLGIFRVYQDIKQITDWPSGKGKAVFKYMLANRNRPVPREILMDIFWSDADFEAARNNLNVSIYGLRQAFRSDRPDFDHIIFEDDHYTFNPAMMIWVDVEEFVQLFEAGQRLERKGMYSEAIREYESARKLYQGDFLEGDLYEDWPIIQREGLNDTYLIILDRLNRFYLKQKRYSTCIQLCQEMLAKDNCREDAHRRLMVCFSRQGRRNLALRQYRICEEALLHVLDVSPMSETTTLYQRIKNGESV
jgi:DNA-binding SARP family transcriptional activator